MFKNFCKWRFSLTLIILGGLPIIAFGQDLGTNTGIFRSPNPTAKSSSSTKKTAEKSKSTKSSSPKKEVAKKEVSKKETAKKEILKAEPSYSPNEIELKITTLTAQLAALKIANTNVTDAYTAVANARIARNITLYKDNTGLYDIAADVKNYVKSLYGISSPEYKELSKIKFTKPITA